MRPGVGPGRNGQRMKRGKLTKRRGVGMRSPRLFSFLGNQSNRLSQGRAKQTCSSTGSNHYDYRCRTPKTGSLVSEKNSSRKLADQADSYRGDEVVCYLPVSATASSLAVMLRGGGCLKPLPPAPPPAPGSVIVVVIVVATPSATCDEDQRDRRYACETELEEAAAGYLFPGLHRRPPS